jgi:1,4-dihydroxy-2-naphthoate octaprenyltransferase
MATTKQWIGATRPRTLPAAIVPVLVGISIASAYGEIHWLRAVLTMMVSLLIQIGTNLANDYSDGVRGTDEKRSGPTRLVGGGLAPPKAVLRAALGAFAVAAVLGLYVALVTSLYILIVGGAAIAAGWFYTGGKHPYGYAGYGELFVFVFFGLVSVIGSTYVAQGAIPWISYLVSVPVGLLTVALLVINNLRDIPTDATTGKRTLAVKIGDARTRNLYLSLIGVSFALVVPIAIERPFAILALLTVVVARRPVTAVHSGTVGRELIPALAGTGALMMSFGLLLAIGIAL